MKKELISFEKIKEFLGDDRDTLVSFFDLFREQSKSDISELEKSIQENNFAEIAGNAHKIKSFYGNIGSVSAYNILTAVEKTAKEDQNIDNIKDLFSGYREVHKKILVEMDNFLKS